MDDKGYTITPLVLLLMIPIIIFAISYGDVIDDLNKISQIAIGGDVTSSAVKNIYESIEKGVSDSGRNATFQASRKVVDERVFLTNSKLYIRQLITDNLNDYVIDSCKQLEAETGREIYINNIPITNYTNATFSINDVNIVQEEPFGFYVTLKPGVPIKVVQNDQVYEGTTPAIKSYVSLSDVEDPYVWIKSKYMKKSIIYKSPYYNNVGGWTDYGMLINNDKNRVKQGKENPQNLWNYLNGTGNPSGLYPLPYYFPDESGLSFFERLNGQRDNSVADDPGRMATFVIGNPLSGEYGSFKASKIDYEYFNKVHADYMVGGTYKFGNKNVLVDPDGQIFYLTSEYVTKFGLDDIKVDL